MRDGEWALRWATTTTTAAQTSTSAISASRASITIMVTGHLAMLPRSLVWPAKVGALARAGEIMTAMADSIFLFLVMLSLTSTIFHRIRAKHQSPAMLVRT